MLSGSSILKNLKSCCKPRLLLVDFSCEIYSGTVVAVFQCFIKVFYPFDLTNEGVHCRTGSNGCKNNDEKLSLEFAIEITPIVPYIGVVFSSMESLSLDRYHFYFLMILKETLTFLSLSDPALQY